MNLSAMPYHFIVRVPIIDEDMKRSNIDGFSLPPSLVFMSRNTQSGEIISIGNVAAKVFPHARVGDTLIYHHFVQGDLKEDAGQLIDQDAEFKYYYVYPAEFNGSNNQVYAVYNGTDIITNGDYLLLEDEEAVVSFVDENGLLVMHNWKEDTDTIQRRIDRIRQDVLSLNKTKLNRETKEAIEKMEAYQMDMAKKAHAKEILPYRVAHSNPSMMAQRGDIVWCFNMAAATKIDLLGSEVRTVHKRHVTGVVSNNLGNSRITKAV
jgi:hypothetical protein